LSAITNLANDIIKSHGGVIDVYSPDIPIILCSGIKDPDTEAQAKSLGIKAYCMKPLTQRELARLIRDAPDG